MKSLSEQLVIYQQQHTQKFTKLTHYIGVPAIIISILMLFNWVSLNIAEHWQISFSWILLIGALLYYFFLSFRLAILMIVIMVPVTYLSMLIARPAPTQLSAIIFLILFFGGWTLQFIGHLFSSSKPAFFESAVQLLIAPLFVLIEALQAMKIAHYFIK